MKPIFFFLVESLTLMKFDRLTLIQRIKIIKAYCKNGDGRWTIIFWTKFSLAMNHISHSLGILINKILVFGVLRILKWLKRGHYIEKKSLYYALLGPKVWLTGIPPNMCPKAVENYLTKSMLATLHMEVI